MKNLFITFSAIFICFISYSQNSLKDLFQNGDFSGVIKKATSIDSLTGEEYYTLGYSYFQSENDKKAIECYDQAIKRGYDSEETHFMKGIAQRFDGQFEESIKSFKFCLATNPNSQKILTEVGNTFLKMESLDSALIYYKKARTQEFEIGEPYYKVPFAYHIQGNYEKALEEYNKSIELLGKNDNKVYLKLLQGIGNIEFVGLKRYDKAVNAYEKLIDAAPENYDLYTKLIKAYYANKDFKKGEKLFNTLKNKYEKKELSEEYQKYGSVAISEFKWNEQTVIVYKYFKEPTNTLDIMYKIYLLSKDGESIERTLMTEKTLKLGKKGVSHLLCERAKNGTHYTYPIGWKNDKIEFESLKKNVLLVLDDKVKPAASSKYN